MEISQSNIEMLRDLYTDLRRIDKYAADDIVLHTAARSISGELTKVFGKENVLAHELNLIRAMDHTLQMDVQVITANKYFGAVIGVLRARHRDTDISMPFCGLWRFANDKIIEHWENAYDADALGRFLRGEEIEAGRISIADSLL